MKAKKYLITDEALRKAVKSCTKNIMAGKRGWKSDRHLFFLKFEIEKILRGYLDGYGGISFEK